MAEKYAMTVDLSVLESLGIRLYSNAAAVLSELVANAYDADATRVDIEWKTTGETIIVTDNGTGMSVKELNERFLKAGYKKREVEGASSPRWHRPFMGRKGIGKLSVFSIAETITVYSTKGSDSNGLRIIVRDLEAKIKTNHPYHPKDVTVPADYAHEGTTIVLTDLRTARADLTANALRKRLARRFDVLHETPENEGGFYISVNGAPITYADRQELKKLEFIWEFGQSALPATALPKGIKRHRVVNNTVRPGNPWKVTGWFGTAKKPTDLTDDEEAGSLKNIIVLARKRPIQEGIIEKLDFSRLFGNYVTGQIEADFLDLDDREDIATSDRQRLMEDDERVEALVDYLRSAFVKAADQWSAERPKKAVKEVLKKYPALERWIESRPTQEQRSSARDMLGTIASLEIEAKREQEDRHTLFRSGVLAFERIGLRKVAADLERLSSVTAEQLLQLLGAQDSYESGLWIDILRSRIEAIAKFRDLSDEKAKEKVVQVHLFDHLWLLDASWERATTDQHMEEDLRKLHPTLFAVDADGHKMKGRIDIRYATSSGKHIIVELKRYGRRLEAQELYDQGVKYFSAVEDVLSRQQKSFVAIEVVFVLGARPGTKSKGALDDEAYIANTFRPINGRYVLYDALIDQAKRQYDDYLEASTKAKELDTLLTSLQPASKSGKSVGTIEAPAKGASAEVPTKKAAAKKAAAKKATGPDVPGKEARRTKGSPN